MPGVPVGLRDLHYALLIDEDLDSGTVTYDTPKKIVGAITANINPNSSVETLFADDGPMETAATIGQITLEMSAANFPLAVIADLLGHTIDATTGIMYRKAGDVPPFVAVGFKSLKSNGSYKFVWLLKGKFRQPEMGHETKGDSVNWQTPTLQGSFVKRDVDDSWIAEADEDDANYTSTTGDEWFNAVPAPEAPTA